MAGDWIKVQHVTPGKPEVFAIAGRLGIEPDAVVGKLLRVWIWADQQTTDGNAPSVTFALLDHEARQAGFAAALVAVGWLRQDGDNLQFSNFDRHNGETAKKRALGSNRQQASRKRNADSVTKSDTEALQKRDQRREEKKLKEKPERTEQGQAYIPGKMNTPECLQAFEQWCDYLDEAKLDAINPRYNGVQAQAVWQQANRIGPETWPLCVQYSIANGYKSIVAKTVEAVTKRQPKSDPTDNAEFLRVVEVCKRHGSASDDDRQKREELLGPELIAAVRKIGSARLADCNDFNRRGLATEWAIHREQK
jgi:hypothetical protein